MIINNNTSFMMNAAFAEAVIGYPTDDLTIELKYCPKGSKRYISGTYYRKTRNYEKGKLIRLRINRNNKYPIEVKFKTSEYIRKKNVLGQETVYQKLKPVKFHNPEDLILAIFLHEFSHYIDHLEARNGKYKETKADKFAVKVLEELGVI